MCFEPQPQEALDYLVTPARLTPFREKIQALVSTKVDRVLCVRFDEVFASKTANEFIEIVLVEKLGVRHIVVGDDFRFGYQAEGDFELLREAGQRCGFDVHRRDTHRLVGDRVSSTRLRNLLAIGQLDLAAKLLGRRYVVSGRVRYGRQLGRTLGFPTVNISLRREVSPVSGVFAVHIFLDKESEPYPGVANIGNRPTMEGKEFLLEVHLLDFVGDLYGRYTTVTLLNKIREERRFKDIDALRAQIAQDADTARNYFINRNA